MAAAFPYGARVRLTKEGIKKRGQQYADWIGTIDCHCSPHTVAWDKGGRSDHEDWELTTNLKPKNMASLSERLITALKAEPEKSFIKAGVIDAKEQLTAEGRDVLLQFLLSKHKEEFKKEVVDPILADQEKEG